MNNIKPYTYLIKFNPSGQYYYGSRIKNVKLGLTPDEDLMQEYTTSSKNINALIKEYGIDAFEWEVRKTFNTVEEAVLWEQKVLKRCRVLERQDVWLNGNIAGHILATPESCQKISEFHKGKPKTEEHKEKLSLAQKGKPKKSTVYQSEEYRKNMSKIKSGAGNGMYGKGCTEERARKIGEANKGNTAHNKGVPMSPEMKARISATKKANAKYITCEHCNKTCIEKMYKRFHGPRCKSRL